MIRARVVAALLVGGAGLGACATKSDFQDLQTDLALFKAEVGRRDSARAAQLGEVIRMQQAILDTVLATNRAVSRFKGDLATDLYNVQQQLVQLQELTGQSQQRLTELRTQLEAREAQMQAVAPVAPVPPADSGVPRPGEAVSSAAQMFDASLDQLRRGSAATARLGFSELIRAHPASDRVPDALYFIGQSYAGENPDSAAVYYQRVVDNHPASLHASSALYNLGVLAELEKNSAKARQYYQMVVERYPRSADADLAREKLKAPGR